ncbi:uncharacterized protein TNCV_394961 [Trichonephila clavipes]|nr:uncharacterized protein TNCV_394961 [Trichonephila clavipes]
MMIPAYNKKGPAAFLSRRESITGEKPISFPKKIQPCLIRDSNPNPLGYKPKVITTLLAGRSCASSGNHLRHRIVALFFVVYVYDVNPRSLYLTH